MGLVHKEQRQFHLCWACHRLWNFIGAIDFFDVSLWAHAVVDVVATFRFVDHVPFSDNNRWFIIAQQMIVPFYLVILYPPVRWFYP